MTNRTSGTPLRLYITGNMHNPNSVRMEHFDQFDLAT